MKKIYLLATCWLFYGSVLMGQTFLVSNPELEEFTCEEGTEACHHFGTCVTDWTITHGSPNHGRELCEVPEDLENHYIQLISQQTKSEGIITSVNIEPGPHRFYIRYRVNEVASNINVRLRASLDLGLVPLTDLTCQDPVPSTSNTHLFVNLTLNEDGEWHWIALDLDVTEDLADRDQLMITSLSTASGQASIHIDCIYLIRDCISPLEMTTLPNETIDIEDGVYQSCSYILVAPGAGGAITVDPGSQVDMFAPEYIRLMPGFRAQNDFRAAYNDVVEVPDTYRPPCQGCGDIDLDKERAASTESTNRLAEQVVAFPNPAQTHFSVISPDGDYDLTIYDMTGRRRHQSRHQETSQITASDWPSGIYLVELVERKTQERLMIKVILQ